MIESIRHKGLKRFYETGDSKALPDQFLPKIKRILTALEAAKNPNDLDIPGYQLHKLKGKLKNHYSVSVSANWRIIFKFVDLNVSEVDLIDYH